MIKKILIILLIIIPYPHLFSAEDTPIISKILIYGNRITKETFIRKVLDLKKGQKFEHEIIEKRRKKLIDLDIFSQVEIETKKEEEGIILLVIVYEKSHVFFEPIINYAAETYKYFYGIKAGYRNLSGKNQELWLTTGIGNLKKIEIGYQNNYYIDFFWGISLGNSWYKNKFYDFKEDRFTGKIYAGKRLSKLETNLWAGYEKIKIDNNSLLNPEDPNELFKLGIDIAFNSKDWEVFPSKGIFAHAGFYKALDGKVETVYDRYMLRISSFFKLWKRHVLALDFKSTVSEGNVPIFEMLYFGGLNTLRGVSIGTYSGSSYIVLTSEYRIPIEKSTGSAFYFFSDYGSITNSIEDFTLKNFKLNFGIGLFWVLMEEAKFRVDLSVSPKLKISVGTGWKF